MKRPENAATAEMGLSESSHHGDEVVAMVMGPKCLGYW
jgi:hypothetical protein